jgi:hypothetical protein
MKAGHEVVAMAGLRREAAFPTILDIRDILFPLGL